MTAHSKTSGIKLRVVLADGVGIGSGKIALLQGIEDTGSISAAGRSLAMSYKRAWYLIEALNDHFAGPLVETAKGGKAGGGAQLTPLGKEVLIAYREMEKLTEAAVSPILRKLRRKVKRARPAER